MKISPQKCETLKIKKNLFIVKKDQITLPTKVLNDKLLQEKFSQPVVLDTRQFHLLNYGTDKIYERVDDVAAKNNKNMWNKWHISHVEAETLNA